VVRDIRAMPGKRFAFGDIKPAALDSRPGWEEVFDGMKGDFPPCTAGFPDKSGCQRG
jgi:hypothetical protein